MEQLEKWFGSIADALWGNWLLAVLVGVGVLYSLLTGFLQVRKFPYTCREIFRKRKDKSEQSISSLEALFTAIASCVGSGNIVGVSTAVLSGGPGALFWMWVAAFFGMATKFAEIVLGVAYRTRDHRGMYVGGPMYYLSKGLKLPWLGGLFALLLFIQNAGGTLIQTNTIVRVCKENFNAAPFATGVVLAVLMTVIIMGGLKRLAEVSTKVVPFMALLYITGGLAVIINNAASLPGVFRSILQGAFSLEAGMGAAAGFSMREAMRYGIARGLYSNEAGEGSAAVLHSSAEVDHPVRQGLYGLVEVFVDTMVICSITGLTVLCSGATASGAGPENLAAVAFSTLFPAFRFVVVASLLLFAGTSLMSQWYFGNLSLYYLVGDKAASVYKFIFPAAILAGSLSSVKLVWFIQDCALGLLIIPNILALVMLSPEVKKLYLDFFSPMASTTSPSKSTGAK